MKQRIVKANNWRHICHLSNERASFSEWVKVKHTLFYVNFFCLFVKLNLFALMCDHVHDVENV